MVSRRQLLRMSMATAGHAAIFVWIGTQYQAEAQGNGNGGGRASGGGGNGGGNGKSGGSGRGGSGSQGSSRDTNSGQSSGGVDASRKDARDAKGSSYLTVQHRTGIQEIIQRGRYIMLDKRGRTIINRRASNADRLRLQSLID